MGFTEILEFWHFWVLSQVKLSAEYSAGAITYKTNKLFEAATKKTDKLPSLLHIFRQCLKNLIKIIKSNHFIVSRVKPLIEICFLNLGRGLCYHGVKFNSIGLAAYIRSIKAATPASEKQAAM